MDAQFEEAMGADSPSEVWEAIGNLDYGDEGVPHVVAVGHYTKIGGQPCDLQSVWFDESGLIPEGAVFLAQTPGVSFQRRMPWPLINREERIPSIDEPGGREVKGVSPIGGMVCFFLTAEGSIHPHWSMD